MDEIWSAVKGYGGKYQVSNMGRVKSLTIISSEITHLDGCRTNNNLSNLELKTSEEN